MDVATVLDHLPELELLSECNNRREWKQSRGLLGYSEMPMNDLTRRDMELVPLANQCHLSDLPTLDATHKFFRPVEH